MFTSRVGELGGFLYYTILYYTSDMGYSTAVRVGVKEKDATFPPCVSLSYPLSRLQQQFFSTHVLSYYLYVKVFTDKMIRNPGDNQDFFSEACRTVKCGHSIKPYKI